LSRSDAYHGTLRDLYKVSENDPSLEAVLVGNDHGIRKLIKFSDLFLRQ
jgi:hypothetical protein